MTNSVYACLIKLIAKVRATGFIVDAPRPEHARAVDISDNGYIR